MVNETVSFSDKVGKVTKFGINDIIDYTEDRVIDGHQILMVHKQNKPKPELIYQRQSILNQLALRLAKKYLSPAQKSVLQAFRAESSKITVQKYREEDDSVAKLSRLGMGMMEIYNRISRLPYEIHTSYARPNAPLNLMLNVGIDQLFDLAIKADTTAADYFDNADTDIGTGTSTTAAAATQTDLQTAGVWVAADATFPSRATETVSVKGTFGSGSANQSWQEFGVRNHKAVTKVVLLRLVTDKGTKSSGETWTLQIDITGS